MKGRKPSDKRIAAAFEELRGLVREHCMTIGGLSVPDDLGGSLHSVAVVVPTMFGALWVWGPHVSEFLTVFARFQDPARGASAFGANPHSGKWNYHSGTIREGATPRATFEAWVLGLNAIKGGTRADVDAAIDAERERRAIKDWDVEVSSS